MFITLSPARLTPAVLHQVPHAADRARGRSALGRLAPLVAEAQRPMASKLAGSSSRLKAGSSRSDSLIRCREFHRRHRKDRLGEHLVVPLRAALALESTVEEAVDV